MNRVPVNPGCLEAIGKFPEKRLADLDDIGKFEVLWIYGFYVDDSMYKKLKDPFSGDCFLKLCNIGLSKLR
jgi:hypothetical protein